MTEYRINDDIVVFNGDICDFIVHDEATNENVYPLIIADPPYNEGIDYGENIDDNLSSEQYYRWCSNWITCCVDALTPNGSMWVLCPEQWLGIYLELMNNLLCLRRIVVWHETFGQYSKKNWGRCARYWLYFTKDPKKFTWNDKDIRVQSERQRIGDKRADPLGKVPDCVWDFSRVCGTFNERQKDFPTQLPVDMLKRIILACSNPGDLVLDAFSGSGSSGVAAMETGRKWHGVDISENYCKKAEDRLQRLHYCMTV